MVRLTRFLRQERPDVFHGYLGTSNYLGVLTRPFHGAKVIWGVRASDLDGTRYDWFYRLDGTIERNLARFPDLLIANSNAGRDHVLRRGFPADKTIVIPNGIDSQRFRPDARLRSQVRAEFGVDEAEVLIGRIGRLDHQKDYPTFIRAAAEIARRRPNARFLCVGTGPEAYERELHELATNLGLRERLIWTGPRADMPGIYNALDLMVSSSAWGEGLPNVVAEAMACGVPCVVTDSGDSAWVVGSTGKVVPPRDVAALCTATVAMLDELAEGRVDAVAIRQRIVRELSMERLYEQTEAVLHDVVRQPKWSAA
jgi:glycosyltransferase involved in cell wall biosynthesis